MKQILCYGDSNTWGLIPGTKDRYPWELRWTGILQRRLEPQQIRVVEEGLCGRTSAYEDSYRENRSGWKTLPFVLETHAPLDGAILMLGTNDCKSCYSLNAAQITKSMEACVERLLTTIPAENILLISPLQLGENVWRAGFDPEFDRKSVETCKALAEEYAKLAERKKILFLEAAAFAVPSEVDQEHLTVEGHAALAEAIDHCLRQTCLFKEKHKKD